MTKKEKFLKLVSKNTNNTLLRNKWRIDNREKLRIERNKKIDLLLS